MGETIHKTYEVDGGVPLKTWTDGVDFDAKAHEQLERVARLPFVHKWVAVMPDVHLGTGATVGSVIPMKGALVPSAVGVDIGCGMMAVQTTLTASQLPDSLGGVRAALERAVPHGRTDNGGGNDRGAWKHVPDRVAKAWAALEPGWRQLVEKHPKVEKGATASQLGTLGTGNHFIELCLDEGDRVWVMLHSGSRGVGNRVGTYFIGQARRETERWFVKLPDPDLGYLPEGTPLFDDYVQAVGWAQEYARSNRDCMMAAVLDALAGADLPPFHATEMAVNCHHNYVSRETHYGASVWVTRKGAVRAREGELGIIPGSMGARSFIVRGRGNDASFHSCSHGAGRKHSRTATKKLFTLEDHARATAGVECRKDEGVLDETPAAYKSIEDVMRAQRDLVDVVHTLRQVVCVKG